jgi:hypothetical protein
MAAFCFLLTLLRRRRAIPSPSLSLHRWRPLSTSTSSPPPPSSADPGSSSPKPPSLSARLSFVFDQLDALDRSRSSDLSARDAALRRIQSWRRPPPPPPDLPPPPEPEQREPKKDVEPEAVATVGEQQEAVEVERMSVAEVLRREVELVHPWPEWIELMERLAQQRYFDLGPADEESRLAAAVPMDLSEVSEESGFDFSRDWTTVKNACMNFGRDRFDILKYVLRILRSICV